VSEPDEYDWPESTREDVSSAKSLRVAIDGTYIRADPRIGWREYHVVAGGIEREGQLGGHFAWIAQHHSCDAEAFLKAALRAIGWTQESQVRGLADGADGWTNVVSAVAEKTTRRVLDWFHISMRLRPIEQMSSGIAIAPGSSDAVWNELLNEKLPRIRDQMWNGQWHAALAVRERSIAPPSNCGMLGLLALRNGSVDSGNTSQTSGITYAATGLD
jgi:hypothetical protein